MDAELSLKAYTLYRQFPPHPQLNLKDILKFSVAGKSKYVARIFIFGALAALLLLFIPFANNIIYSFAIPNQDQLLLVQAALGLLAFLITSSLFVFARERLIVYLDGTMDHDLQHGLWQRLFELPVGFFRKFELGDLIIRSFTFETIRQRISGPYLRVIVNSVFSSFFLISMLYYSPLLTLIGLILVLPAVFYAVYTLVRNYRGNQEIIDIQERANAYIVQFLNGIAKIRYTGAENLSFVLWEKVFFQFKKRQWILEKLINHSKVLAYTLSQAGNLFIFAATIFFILESPNYNLSLGNFLAFLISFGLFREAAMDLCTSSLDICNSLALWKNSKVLIEEPPESNASKAVLDSLNGEIRADRLTFRYDPTGPLILDDVSLFANPGEFIAIVGASGSGKSTLIRLLIGFEAPESGAIYYDGKDLSTLNLQHLRKQIGTIIQGSTIFGGNLRENVNAEEFYSDQEIMEALRLVGFDEDLKLLPMGLNTIITSDKIISEAKSSELSLPVHLSANQKSSFLMKRQPLWTIKTKNWSIKIS